MDILDNEAMREAFQYPILEAISRRRSRRFPIGCTLSEGALKYVSHQKPVPLSELESSILCWSGAGITGSIAGDLGTKFGATASTSWVGKATPYASNVHNTKLFFTNDAGTFVYDPHKATKSVEIDTKEDREKIITCYREDTRKIIEERVEFVPKALLAAMHWNINQPGTTIFIPVVDQVEEYINFIFSIFDYEGYGYRIIDDLKGQSAGLQGWIDQGKLKGPEVLLSSFERSLLFLNIAPAYFILENIHLVAESMGLGSVIFGGYTGQVMLGITSMSKGLGFRGQTGKNGQINPIGLDGIFEAYCPPYYRDMNAAIDAFIDKKFSLNGPYAVQYKGVEPYKDWNAVQPEFKAPSKLTINQVKTFFSYLYETYGRVPVTTDAKLLPAWLQVHHLDIDFYDKYLKNEMLNESQRRHMHLWHK